MLVEHRSHQALDSGLDFGIREVGRSRFGSEMQEVVSRIGNRKHSFTRRIAPDGHAVARGGTIAVVKPPATVSGSVANKAISATFFDIADGSANRASQCDSKQRTISAKARGDVFAAKGGEFRHPVSVKRSRRIGDGGHCASSRELPNHRPALAGHIGFVASRPLDSIPGSVAGIGFTLVFCDSGVLGKFILQYINLRINRRMVIFSKSAELDDAGFDGAKGGNFGQDNFSCNVHARKIRSLKRNKEEEKLCHVVSVMRSVGNRP